MSKSCPITGITRKKIRRRSHSMRTNEHSHREVNFVIKKVGNKRVKISARAWKTLRKKNQPLTQELINKAN